MLLTILLICLLIAALNLALFQGSVWMSLGAIVFCAAGAVLWLLRKKISARLAWTLSLCCLALAVLLLWNAGCRVRPGGLLDYEKRLVKVREFLAEDELDKAVGELTELEELYGLDDNSHILLALENLCKKDLGEARSEMERVEDKYSRIYYSVMERIYIADPSPESVEQIYRLYREAAEEWPDWTYMQKYAGIAAFEQKNYAGAEYFLLRAYGQDKDDYRTAYYLGAVNCCLEREEESRRYFDEAVRLGADDTTCSNILWYLEQMEGEGDAE